MPGIQFAGSEAGFTGVPNVNKYLLANSLTGTGTPPAAAVYTGDIVALTQASALTSGGNTVVRQLLAADKTAHYLQGSPVAGLLGVCMNDVQSNASGIATAPPYIGPGVTSGAPINYPLSESAMWGADRATNRNYMKVALFEPGNVFLGRLNMVAGAITLQHQYDGLLAGIIMTTTSGVTQYTIDSATASGADACVRIIGPNEQDPLYNTLVASGSSVQGPSVFFEVLSSFCQFLTNVVYTSQ